MDVDDLIQLGRSRETIAQAAMKGITPTWAGQTIIGDLTDALEDLARKYRELSDRLWTADRTAHAHDPWEAGEDA